MHTHHITVCICTFKRPALLQELLNALTDQTTGGLFTYSVVVADNDPGRSAEQPVAGFASGSQLVVTYCHQPKQNIALTRNAALQHSSEGDLVAFIDDDEVPVRDWLHQMFTAYKTYGVAGILGPVRPRFHFDPPGWVKRGCFFDRPSHKTGYRLTWTEARTGNVLFRRDILQGATEPFDIHFDSAGEDMDFFRRMMDQGHVFLWCEEAPVYEVVPPYRCNRAYLFKRALLRGSNFSKHPADRLKNLLKSLVAVPCYAMVLPVLLVLGQHLFIRYTIKLLDHGSRILAFLGYHVVTERTT